VEFLPAGDIHGVLPLLHREMDTKFNC
jgi:hypothetical protein